MTLVGVALALAALVAPDHVLACRQLAAAWRDADAECSEVRQRSRLRLGRVYETAECRRARAAGVALVEVCQ